VRWENVRNFLFGERGGGVDEVRSIEPRPLTERETSWIRDIFKANSDWHDADISQTHVFAEGLRSEGISINLQAPKPENPKSASMRGLVGHLWISLDDGAVINVQLDQFEGRLREIYVLFVDAKHPKRRLPETWIEVSRKASPG
jgi:hypothetical protein